MVNFSNSERGGQIEIEREEAEYRRHELDDSIISDPQPVQIYINNYSELGRAAFGQAGYMGVSL